MVDSPPELDALPTRIDRYPAKMISHLAARLVDRYAADATHLLDPFCGSGAVLKAGSQRGKRVTGIDVNPFGVLLSSVKMQGFDGSQAATLCEELLSVARHSSACSVEWENKFIWFTPATLGKYERIRYAARQMQLYRSKAGRAVLLALALSVRRCSRSDQRSPKPFISRYAREARRGRHFDPARVMRSLLVELTDRYGRVLPSGGEVHQLDVTRPGLASAVVSPCSHVITSPPYINAQDYFRNFNLELYLLEGVLPFKVNDIMDRFIGTERGVEVDILSDPGAEQRRHLVPELRYLERTRVKLAAIVHRYLEDMSNAFCTMKTLIRPGGVVVLVCGDNLIGGRRICTWRVLNAMLRSIGFKQFDSFGDRIRNRAVAPMRCGHKGIIKQEIVSAFRLRA